MADPFNDPLFRDRARKLMAVIASDQPGEAEAARRKLLAHLETHGAAWTDLVDRVDVPSAVAADRSALLRRAERAEAALRDAVAAATAAAEARIGRAERRARAALIALGYGGAGVAALAAVLLLGPTLPVPPLPVPPTAGPGRAAGQAPGPAPALVPALAPLSDPARTRPAPADAAGGQVGYVGVAGAALRPALSGAAPTRPLPGGAPVVVVGRTQFEGAEWFRVRSEQGEGFLPAEAVGFTAPPADGAPGR